MSDHPELDKMAAVRAESLLLSEFVDWLASEGLVIYNLHDDEPVDESYERMFARFFDIDLAKVERERRAILASLSGDG